MSKRRAERWVVGAIVVLMHVALLALWRGAMVSTHRGTPAPEPQPATVMLLTLEPQPLRPRQPPREATREPPAPATAARPAPRAKAPSDASTVSVTPEAITMQLPAAPPDAASSPQPTRLDLAVPRSVVAPGPRPMRDQALNDPRANSSPASVESRVAAVAGTPVLIEERMDATRTRFHKNGKCIEVHVSRNAQLDPWNQSHSPTPKQVKPEC